MLTLVRKLLLLSLVLIVAVPSSIAESPPPKNPPVANNVQDLFVELAKRLVPTVVNIYTTQKVTFAGDDYQRRLLEEFFGVPKGPTAPRQRSSLGTGFIIDAKEGLILTNYHVIDHADSIKVLLHGDKRERDAISAKVIGGDVEGDLALLKIVTKKKLSEAPLGSSTELQVGEWVMAIGNPFGLGSSVTKGIVSAKGRIFPMSQFANYIQTDTPINPGNSGGPLINTRGEVIGINTFINAAAQGIGFAIQADYIKQVLPDLRKTGKVTRGYIGVQIAELTREFAENLKLDRNTTGVIVTDVHEGNSADKAGMRPYDVIVSVGEKPVTTPRELVSAITAVRPGKKVELTILRNGKSRDLKVRVAKRPSRGRNKFSSRGKKRRSQTDLGMEVSDLTYQEALERGLPKSIRGAVVRTVRPGGPAHAAGIMPGSVIVEVNRKLTPTSEEFYRAVRRKGKYLIRILVEDKYILRTLDLTQ